MQVPLHSEIIMDMDQLTKRDANTAESGEALASIISTIDTMLHGLFPDTVAFGDGSFTLTRGSAVVMVVVRAFGDKDYCVECTSHVVAGATLSDDLLKYLLRKNSELHFGGFSLLFDDTIAFSYTLPTAHMSAEELSTAVNAVAIISDYYDDEIVAMAGGRRAADAEERELQQTL